MDEGVKRTARLVGENVARLRARANLSLGDLSAMSGIDQSRIESIETGRVDCWMSELNAIARALGEKPSALFR